MATPDFIRELRATAGQQLLFLPGISAVVVDDGRVLLHRRADTGRWSIIGGIPEPGEQPAQTAVREVREETGVVCTVERVVGVEALDPIQYPNGDKCQFMDITLRCRATGGEARVNDDEGLEVGWFAPDALPPDLEDFARHRIRLALADGPTWFAEAAATPGA
ncbi:NUDIX hydrolase [Streptomyces sp. WAC 06738]|jgi:8-oxo-dGTP pyrophosphatase MutT (NUDIX family)|uniref:NUDIX hydrolase n=1 Tax=Streptomyces sp. WAC 06738 TaxID=2203210 RepID=UPI000F6D9AB5|nr:NUDIX domain-containing protein [Streptomyces sp. WAC 06738]AZM44708.1 NUDIX hydrolase [Streptomyces sp. WAC 06738]